MSAWELIREQARARPAAIALSYHGTNLSYAELDQRTTDLAAHFQGLGVVRGGIVALCLDRSPELVIALLAVLKAGGVYLPLDPAYPPERLAFMLEDSGAGIALRGTLGERCCELGRMRVLLDGTETFDRTGIWQNKSSAGRPLPGSLLFAWRWKSSGPHVIELRPDAANAKEGGPFADVRGVTTIP